MTKSKFSGRITEELRTRLGSGAVLLKIPMGQKGPRVKGWQETTLINLSEDYLSELDAGEFNIGVLLGQPSNGLCSIDIDDDTELEKFLNLNPALRETFQTRGARGANIWVRLIGEYPRLTKIHDTKQQPWGEFRADGGQTVVYGRHPSGCDYTVVVDKTVLEIAFGDINWPNYLALPWNGGSRSESQADSYVELRARQGEPFLQNEKGGVTLNQGCLAELFCIENLILYEPAEREFYRYKGENGLWERQTPTRIADAVEKMVRRLMLEAGLERAVSKITANLVDSLIKLIRPKVENPTAFSRPRNIVHLLNGVIDLDAEPMTLNTFSPDYFSRNQLAVEYVEGADCPRFVEELLRPCLNEEDVHLLQRIMGSLLLPKNAAQALVLLTGAAGSGKSTLVSIIESIIGEENVHELRTENLGGRFEAQFYLGKRLLTGKDVPGRFLQGPGAHVLKKLCGHDLLTAEKKGSNESMRLRGDFHLLITSNSNLHVSFDGDSEAWRRRMILLEWNKPQERQRIPNFDDVLMQEEGCGILNWMLDGLSLHREELSRHGKFVLTASQEKRIDDLLNESDSVRGFVVERLSAKQACSVTSRELMDEYESFCFAQDWQPKRRQEAFGEMRSMILEVHGVRQSHDLLVNGQCRRGYRNLTIRN